MSETKPKRRWVTFSIRDLLWLTAIVGLMTAFWADHRQLMKSNDSYEQQSRERGERNKQLIETVQAQNQLVDKQPAILELSDISKFDDKAVDLTFRSIWNERHRQKQSKTQSPAVTGSVQPQ